MRKSAAEYLKRLEMRVARLERQAKYVQWDGMLWDSDAVQELERKDPARYDQMLRDLEEEGIDRIDIYHNYRNELVDKAHNNFRKMFKPPHTKIGKILAGELAKVGAELRFNKFDGSKMELVVAAIDPEYWENLSEAEWGNMGYGITIFKDKNVKAQITRVNQIIRKVLRKYKVDFQLYTVKAQSSDLGSIYDNSYGVTHTIFIGDLADLQERGLLGSKRMRLDIRDLETHGRKERLRNRRR